MFQLTRQAARRVLGPRLTASLKRLKSNLAPRANPSRIRTGTAVLEPSHRSTFSSTPPANPPRRVLFLSDCYAEDLVWAPFHKTMLAYCGAAFERMLAIRTNDFFHPWTHRPLSEEHLVRVQQQVLAFAPDLVFSINRAGLSEGVLVAVHPDVKILTVFVDYYDRLPDEMHRYEPRDRVWATGTSRLRTAYLQKYSARLRPEQVIHTLWGVDHHLFQPQNVERTTGIIFVGSAFNPEAFLQLIEWVSGDEHNRRILFEACDAHREEYVYDWPEQLRRADSPSIDCRRTRCPTLKTPGYRPRFVTRSVSKPASHYCQPSPDSTYKSTGTVTACGCRHLALSTLEC